MSKKELVQMLLLSVGSPRLSQTASFPSQECHS
jgi:hypothetical protein